MIIGIDHVIIVVEDLVKATETWREAGFQVIAGGEHPQFGTHNALVPLADGFYFELMAIKDPTLLDQFPITRRLKDILTCENRFLGFALDSDDLAGDVDAIREHDLPVQKASQGERLRPDGQRVIWRTAHPDDTRLPFLIQDQTPRELRVPMLKEGIGRSLGIARVEVTAKDPKSLRENYCKLLGGGSADRHFPLERGEIWVALNEGPADQIDRVKLIGGDGSAPAVPAAFAGGRVVIMASGAGE
jgi:hypothetical protein